MLFGILINVIANGIEKLLKKFGKKHFIPQPLLDSEGNEILLEDIDLKQEECTYKGECSGTCPKCKQEEEILNCLI